MNKLLKIQETKYVSLIEKIRNLIKGSIFEGKVYVVGGAVRDAILGNPIKDIDLVVEAPDGGIGFATWLTYHTDCHTQGKNPCIFPTYGTAKFQILTDPEIADIELECVQTRKEKYDKETRNPATAYGSIQEDAMRRDLTINALYYNISTDEVCDFCGRGLEDIKNHVIRTTGDADLIFDDDPLRILRVVRFANRLGWPIERNTWIGMITNSKRIGILTQERVTDELNKMLLSKTPSNALRMLDRCSVLNKVLPSLTMSKHIYQDLRPIKTLFEHTLDVIDKTPAVLETRLAALFHDIGKIKTYTRNFMFHQEVSAEMAREIMHAMKYSNAVTESVVKAIEMHESFSSYIGGTVPRSSVLRKFIVEFEGNDKNLEIALDLIHANNISQTYGKKAKQVSGIRAKIQELDKKNESCKKLVMPVNGKDIMDEFNLKPGPSLGLIMDKIKSKVIENPKMTKEEAFKFVEEYLKTVV